MSGTNAEQAAWDELDRLTDGSPGKLWRWSIPADPSRDSDLILAAGLKSIAAERDAALALLVQEKRAPGEHDELIEDARGWVRRHPEAPVGAIFHIKTLIRELEALPTLATKQPPHWCRTCEGIAPESCINRPVPPVAGGAERERLAHVEAERDAALATIAQVRAIAKRSRPSSVSGNLIADGNALRIVVAKATK